MKALIRWKIDSIKRKLVKFITNGFKIPSNLSKITENIKHSLYEFYLEYFKINTNLIKESNRILNLMFEINTTIDNFEKLPSKYLINIIDFWTLILKNSEEEIYLQKIIASTKFMILQSTNSDETIKNSIHSFIKMIYFNPKSINDVW